MCFCTHCCVCVGSAQCFNTALCHAECFRFTTNGWETQAFQRKHVFISQRAAGQRHLSKPPGPHTGNIQFTHKTWVFFLVITNYVELSLYPFLFSLQNLKTSSKSDFVWFGKTPNKTLIFFFFLKVGTWHWSWEISSLSEVIFNIIFIYLFFVLLSSLWKTLCH